jgi:CHAT domain
MRPLVRGYDELKLRIDRRAVGSHHVFASTSSAEASATFELPFGELELENFILKVSRPRGRRRIDTSAIGEARRFGGALFKAVFHGEINDLYRDALAHARAQGRGVRITLCLSDSPDLIDVPWEYLFDDPHFLAVSAFTPVVRYLDMPRGHRPLLVEPPLRLLGVVSSPAEYEQLDVEGERANLEGALAELSDAGAIELHWLERPTLGALLRALQTHTFHALHYIGHGVYDRDAERGVLLFEDDAGWARPVSGDKLGMIVHDFSSLRLTVLNACEGARTSRSDPFAGVAGSLVQRDIPAVVAMQFEISDEAAIVFAGGFYRPLAAGLPVDTSLAAARLAMLAERSDDIEWGTPVLFMRVPDGRLFDLQRDPADNGQAELASATPAPIAPRAANVTRTAPARSAAGAQRETPGRLRGRHRLLAAGGLAALLAVGAVVAALTAGGSTVHRSFRATAAPFRITYSGSWRAVNTPVTGTFVVASSARGGSDSATTSRRGSVRLVSGYMTLAAGELTASAPVPGGIPPALQARYGHPTTAADVVVAGHRGREYTWSSPGGRVVAYVLATSAGDGAIICGGPAAAAGGFASCRALAERASVTAETILAPGADRQLAQAIVGPLIAVKAIRSTVSALRGPLPARAEQTADASQAEDRAAASLRKLSPPPRYQKAVAQLAAALHGEATTFTALARAAQSNNRGAYTGAVREISTVSRTLDTVTRRVEIYELGVPELVALRLSGPPPISKHVGGTPLALAPASTTTPVSPPTTTSTPVVPAVQHTTPYTPPGPTTITTPFK